MRSAAAILTFATFCLHAVFGCCAHHVHAESAEHACGIDVAQHDDHECEHGLGHEHDRPQLECSHGCSVHSHPPTHSPCDETTCTFLGVGKSTLTIDDLNAAHVSQAVGCQGPAEVAAERWRRRRELDEVVGPPIPRYLFHLAILA